MRHSCIRWRCSFHDFSTTHLWISAKLLSIVCRGTKPNWLGLAVKRSKVKVTVGGGMQSLTCAGIY